MNQLGFGPYHDVATGEKQEAFTSRPRNNAWSASRGCLRRDFPEARAWRTPPVSDAAKKFLLTVTYQNATRTTPDASSKDRREYSGGNLSLTMAKPLPTIPLHMKLFDLSGEVAVVIGATGALGGALAEGLAEAGAKIAVLGRHEERGKARVKIIETKGGQAAFFACDAISRCSLTEARTKLEANLGVPTILVNAAGGNDPKVTVTAENSFEKIPLEAWRENFDLNLVGGVLLPCQEFGPGMCQRGKGSIINIASVSAHLPLSRVVAYSAAKAAVLNLSLFLAREWATKGVRVNTITPGFFPGGQNRKLLFKDDGSPSDRTKSIWAHTPMNRFGEAHELIGAAVFLASSRASSFVTGTDIRVDGGFLSQTI
jgi:NAD(P)-dependent dehydrogenase (short-subunit alcohol dehydrogenase family)